MEIIKAVLFILVGFAVSELHNYSVKNAENDAYKLGYRQAQKEEDIRNGDHPLRITRKSNGGVVLQEGFMSKAADGHVTAKIK